MLALVGCFLLSSFSVYGVLWLTGEAARTELLPLTVRAGIALALLVTALVFDSGLSGLTPPGWPRQTPRAAWHAFGPVRASALWGFDTGLGFTTYRVTSLTWVGFGLAFLHLAPWWAGAAYGIAFTAPMAADVLLPAGERDSSGGYYQSRYVALEPRLRIVGRVLLAVAALAVGTSLVMA